MCKSYGGVCLTTSTNLHRIYTTCISHCSPSTLIQIQLNQLCNPTNIKVKVKVTLDRPRGPRRAVEVQLYSFLTSAQDGGGGWSTPCPGRLTPQKESWNPLCKRLGGSHGRSGQVRKISPSPGCHPRTVQPDCAIPAPILRLYLFIFSWYSQCDNRAVVVPLPA